MSVAKFYDAQRRMTSNYICFSINHPCSIPEGELIFYIIDKNNFIRLLVWPFCFMVIGD